MNSRRRSFLKGILALGAVVLTGFKPENGLRDIEVLEHSGIKSVRPIWRKVRMKELSVGKIFRFSDTPEIKYIANAPPYISDLNSLRVNPTRGDRIADAENGTWAINARDIQNDDPAYTGEFQT